MAQPAFDFGVARPEVVLRLRPDDRIEARWPEQALCATFDTWPHALELVIERLNQIVYPEAPSVVVKVRV